MYKSANRVQSLFVVVLILGACNLACQNAQATTITWDAPVAITTADATLTQPGTVVSAATWGPTATTVTLTGGQSINFAVGSIDGSSPVANVTASSSGNTGAFLGDTGNADFNNVLGGFAGDGDTPLSISLHNLNAGHDYTVQLFALDNRNPVVGVRQIGFSDMSDQSGNNSAAVAMSENKYVMGAFTATGTSATVFEQFLTYQDLGFAQGYFGNLNALVVRDVTVPEPGAIVLLGTGVFGLLAYAWRKRK